MLPSSKPAPNLPPPDSKGPQSSRTCQSPISHFGWEPGRRRLEISFSCMAASKKAHPNPTHFGCLAIPPPSPVEGQIFSTKVLSQHTYHNDQHNALIILRYVCWGNKFLDPAGPWLDHPPAPPPPQQQQPTPPQSFSTRGGGGATLVPNPVVPRSSSTEPEVAAAPTLLLLL